jgi:hypothetical protein
MTPTFALERFDWGAPDRLELAGTFSGIDGAPSSEPVLTVQGPDGPRRLPSLQEGDGAGPPADGAPWSAAFAWLEAPVAFERARLELGATLAVDLPAPGGAVDGGALPVEHAPDGDGAGSPPDASGAADRLLAAHRRLEQTRADARRAEEELERAQTYLAAEREREARSEIAALRERIAGLEPVAAELEATRAELDAARTALGDARGAAQAMLARLADPADPASGGR